MKNTSLVHWCQLLTFDILQRVIDRLLQNRQGGQLSTTDTLETSLTVSLNTFIAKFYPIF